MDCISCIRRVAGEISDAIRNITTGTALPAPLAFWLQLTG
jgi:hypothetical protein